MTKRYTKKTKSKRHLRNGRKTRKNKHGGEPTNKELVAEQDRKYAFRQNFKDSIIQITNKKKINEAINKIIRNFKKNIMINTLIPISASGKPLDTKTYSPKNPIVDYVSPVIVIFDNLTGKISDKDLIRLLDAYHENGGNFNNLSSRFKITPIENEINKRRINNVRILLSQSYPFRVIEDGLNEETKIKLAELMPTEQKVNTEPALQPTVEAVTMPKLNLPYPLPENNDVGYNRSVIPEFWNPIFENGENLITLRDTFMQMYEEDRYTEDIMKEFKICNLLEKLFPAYLTKYYFSHKDETAKMLVNMNICSCIITLLYGMITYKLYDSKQDYLILFKGGRAIQLSLIDIPNVLKYFSEDADILIIPNKTLNAEYNFEKMENLSAHIAYLVKWFIPEEINIVVSLPSNPKNQNREITKILYKDDKYKALSDVGFGEMKEDIRRYFETPIYTSFYVDDFETIALFIIPTIDDMLCEKLYFYAKYLIIRDKLKNKIPITETEYKNITIENCDYYIYKFNRAIKQLVNSILKRNDIDVDDSLKIKFPETDENFKTYPRQVKLNIYKNIDDKSKVIIRGVLENFDDFSAEEKDNIIKELYPQFN
jgi:hypothetical protein